MAVAVRPVPRSTAGRLSPISPGPSPRLAVLPRPSWPLAVVAPALDGAVVEEGAGVVGAGGDGGGGAAGAEVDGGEVVAHLVGAVAAAGGVAEAELAVAVAAPALDGAVVEEGAGVARRRR